MAASVVAVTARTRRFYFFSDDFLNFIITVDMGLSWKYLFRDVFGQFIPLYRLAVSLYLHVFGLQFWPFRILLVIFSWSATCLLSRLAWRRGVGVTAMLPTLVLLTFSPVFVTPYQWWSAALSVLTSAIASLVCIIFVARPEPPDFARKLAVAMWFLIGLLCYPKCLFTIVLLVAIRLFFRAANARPAIWPMLLGSLRDVWPTLALAPIYLGIVHFGHYSSGAVRPDVVTLARFIWTGWNSGFLTATLGLHYGAAGIVAANVLVFALVLWSVARNPVSLYLWSGFGVYFVICIGVIGWNRAVPFGIESAEIGRYYADIFCLFLAVLVIAIGHPAGDRQNVSRPGLMIAVVASAVASIHLIDAGTRVPHLWYAGPARPAAFVADMRAALSATSENLPIADGPVPDDIMPVWMAPLNRYRYFVKLLGWRGKVVEDQSATHAFDRDGNFALPYASRP